ncbi:MAG: CoA transferase [Verrucomicrobiia bacterium]
MEANRPGVADCLGFGYDTLRDLTPLLVYCSISAFGQDGPYAQRPAYVGRQRPGLRRAFAR